MRINQLDYELFHRKLNAQVLKMVQQSAEFYVRFIFFYDYLSPLPKCFDDSFVVGKLQEIDILTVCSTGVLVYLIS